ncbi:hypothetical protein JN00_0016 [Metamycoplasma subdolum]|uniref:Lipoprotein n=1 Tax=Metamycoplasma subdolum TaxID=92407 RepID=A0A3M0AIN5_9BACT|nr:hypothetical protein [Metamycoplasma subdolum]RMA78972.1 hypothetical protein JN00_0016 [Metamycoplasma subdolum]WPB50495.1 hypothetical protein R9C05_02710 [Metamycoplasma subdolum]
MKTKKILFSFFGLASISLPLVSASCVNVPQKNNQWLSTTQLQKIQASFVLEKTDEGKKKTDKELYDFIKDCLKQAKAKYGSNEVMLRQSFKNNLKQYIILDYIDINAISEGHRLNLKFEFDDSTKQVVLKWTADSPYYHPGQIDGEGKVILE